MSDSNPNTDGNNDPAPQPAEPTVETSPESLFADQLAGIKTPDGRQKYADVPTALDSIPHAQGRISELSAENAALKAQLEASKGTDDVLEQLKKLSQPTPTETPSSQGIDAAQIQQILDERLQAERQQQVEQANADIVLSKLKDRFGDKAESEFNTKAQQLGMTVEQLSNLARQTPNAALAFFPENAAPANPATGSVNTETFNQPASTQPNLDIFNGGTSESVKSWRDAAPD